MSYIPSKWRSRSRDERHLRIQRRLRDAIRVAEPVALEGARRAFSLQPSQTPALDRLTETAFGREEAQATRLAAQRLPPQGPYELPLSVQQREFPRRAAEARGYAEEQLRAGGLDPEMLTPAERVGLAFQPEEVTDEFGITRGLGPAVREGNLGLLAPRELGAIGLESAGGRGGMNEPNLPGAFGVLGTPAEAASTLGTLGVGGIVKPALAAGATRFLASGGDPEEAATSAALAAGGGLALKGAGAAIGAGTRRAATNLAPTGGVTALPGRLATEEAGGIRLPRFGRAAEEAGEEAPPPDPIDKFASWLDESSGALATGRKARQAQVAQLRRRQAGALGQVYGRTDLTPQEQVQQGLRSLEGTAGETPIGAPPLDEGEIGGLLTRIRDYPVWQNRPFKALNAQQGLLEMMNGELPSMSKLGLLEQVFGPKLVRSAARASGSGWREAAAALGLPRTVRTILDVSFPLRQGIGVLPRHPKEVLGNLPRGIYSTFSEKAAQQWDQATRLKSRAIEIVGDDGVKKSWTIGELQDEVGVFLPRIDQEVAPLAERTEEFMPTQGSDTWVGRAFGPLVRPFQRNFITLGNATRSDIFENSITGRSFTLGKPVTMEDARALAWLVNVGTGRGDLGKLNQYGALLAQPFFSPRLAAGRVEHALSPAILATGAAGAPKSLKASQLAAQQLVSFVGAGIALLGAASQVPGIRVDRHILSPKWGKIEIGYDPKNPLKKTSKIDLFGGYQQYARFIAQMISAKGKADSGELYDRKRWDITEQFLRNKAAPNVATVWDILSGESGVGEKVDLKTAAGIRTFLWNDFTPLAINDVVEAINRDDGIKPEWALTAPYSLLGGGVQTYGDRAQNVAWDMPKYEGLDKKQEGELDAFMDEVEFEYQRARKAQTNFTKAEVAEIVGQETGRKNLGEWAAMAIRDELDINKERVEFAIEHQDELDAKSLKAIVPDDILRDYLTEENFERVFKPGGNGR